MGNRAVAALTPHQWHQEYHIEVGNNAPYQQTQPIDTPATG
jgi:hypothetical protein